VTNSLSLLCGSMVAQYFFLRSYVSLSLMEMLYTCGMKVLDGVQ
jgi:hypothetical protein